MALKKYRANSTILLTNVQPVKPNKNEKWVPIGSVAEYDDAYTPVLIAAGWITDVTPAAPPPPAPPPA